MSHAHRNRSAARRHRQVARRRRQYYIHLSFEKLEERCLLATIVWDGGPTGSGTDWNAAANWFDQTNMVNDVQPGSNDDVQIGAAFTGITIAHATANTTIRSLTSAASLQIDSGSFAIAFANGAPQSQIDKPFIIVGGSLALDGGTLNGPGQLINAATLTTTASTVNAPLENQGLLQVLSGGAAGPSVIGSAIGAFTTTNTSTIRVRADNSIGGGATLTVVNGFTNNGLIELTSINGNEQAATLNVTNGSLTNAPNRTIDVLAGTGGRRALNAQLDNSGIINIGIGLTNNAAGAHHVNSGTINVVGGNLAIVQSGATPVFDNSGTINIAGGRIFASNGGTFAHNAGAISGAGTLSLSGAAGSFLLAMTTEFLTLTDSTANYQPALTATSLSVINSTFTSLNTVTNAPSQTLTLSGGTLNAPLENQGLLQVLSGGAAGPSVIGSAIGAFTTTNTSTIQVRADNSIGGGTALTVVNGFTNNGLIELTSINGNEQAATLNVTNGSLTNAPNRNIDVLAGTGGGRALNAQLDNQGIINVGIGLTNNAVGAHHVNSGTINVLGGNLALVQSGATPTFDNTGTINIAGGRTFASNGGTFAHNAGSISGAGTLSISSATGSFLVAVTAEFLTLTDSTANYQPALTATSLSVINSTFTSLNTVTNAPNRTLTLSRGTLNAPLENQGLLQVLAGSPVGLSVIGSAAGAFTTTSTSTIRVLANNGIGSSTLTVVNGFTNNGLIELTSINGNEQSATLNVTNGSLTNAPNRTIDVLAGTGGLRAFNAQLDNQGTINVGIVLTNNAVGAHHVNSGTINVVGGSLALSQSGATPTFDNTGTINIADGRTFAIINGTLKNLSAGTLTGGTYLVAGTFQFTDATIATNAANIVLDGVRARIVNQSNGNALREFANNLAGASLSLRNGANMDTQAAVTNAGVLAIGAGSTLTITGDYSQTATGSFDEEIGGNPNSFQFGRIIVSGRSNLDGAFQVSLVNGYGPQQGHSFAVQNFSVHTGNFATLSGLNLGRVRVFDVVVGNDKVRLNAIADAGDLEADANSIEIQPNGTSGEDVPLTYTIRNSSTTPVLGNWFDSIYLSNDAFLDANDTLVARVEHTGGLDGLASYKTAANFPLPGTLEGDYRLIIVADSRGLVPDRERRNNTAVSNSVIRTQLEILTLDRTTTVVLDGGEQKFFRLDVPASNDLQLGLKFSQAALFATSGVFVLFGQIPTPGSFDQVASNERALQQDLLLLGRSGTHYVLVRNPDPAGHMQTIDLTPVTLAFSIQNIVPNRGSHRGQVTVTVAGAGFTPMDGVVLQNSEGAARPAQRVLFKDSNKLFATFDLTGLAIGSYDLKVTRGVGAVTNPMAFSVTDGKLGHVSFRVESPPVIRAGTVGTMFVNYINDGETDVPAPLVRLQGRNVKVAPPGITLVSNGSGGGGGGGPGVLAPSSQNPIRAQSSVGLFEQQFLASDRGGLGGVLSPGGHGAVGLSFLGSDTPSPPLLIFTPFVDELPASPHNWNAVKEALRPRWVSPEAWDLLFAKFLARVGSTDLEFQTALDEVANYQSLIGQTTTDVAQLTAFIFEQADNAYPGGILAASIDAAAPAAGLTMARVFSSLISRRYEIGAFGRGWLHGYEMTLLKVDADHVIIHGPGGERTFKRKISDPRERSLPNLFIGEFGDPGRLELGIGNSFSRLIDTEGTVYTFDATRLVAINDSNYNRVSLNYTNGLLTSAVHSNGDRFAFEYNAQGHIGKIKDQADRPTEYLYDASGEHLLQVKGPQGNIDYTYDTGHGAASEHAITSVANNNGTHVFYSFDGEGRLVHSEIDGGAEAVSLSYGPQGTVAYTDAAGATGTVLFDSVGHAAQVRDALGQIVTRAYDKDSHLDRERLPGNLTVDFDIDQQGFLKRRFDPSGHVVVFNFGPTSVFHIPGFETIRQNFRLRQITNELGIRTDFQYDGAGNLRSIQYPEGPSPQFSYDAVGNLSDSHNRRGQIITYTHDARGQLTRKSHANGTHEDYSYDNRGNLLTASDVHGTTAFQYDTGDRLTRVIYPNGRFLAYTHDSVGRLTRLEAQDGFAVTYTHDAAGRLSSVLGAAGATLASYSYDPVGRLIRQAHANGTFTTYEHDAVGRVTHLVNFAPDNSVNSRFDYAYDSLGRRTQMITLDGVWTYGHDALGQIIHAVFASANAGIPNQDLQYEYDPAGNRIRTTQNGIVTPYTTNMLDQYTLVGGANYGYDADGNLIAVGSGATGTSNKFDDEGRLVRVTTPAGTWAYEYDVLGSRVASVHNGQRTEYLLDPTGLVDVVGEYSGTGSALAHYAYGLGLAGRVGADGTASFYDFDATGSTAGLTGTNGSYVNTYNYLPFGEPLAAPQETVANPFEFVGQLGVMQEGNGLDFMRARYYSPTEGRFISADPIGIVGGLNLYRYVANNPEIFVDPLGLSSLGHLTPAEFEASIRAAHAEIQAIQRAVTKEVLESLYSDSVEKVFADAAERAALEAKLALQREVTQIVRIRTPIPPVAELGTGLVVVGGAGEFVAVLGAVFLIVIPEPGKLGGGIGDTIALVSCLITPGACGPELFPSPFDTKDGSSTFQISSQDPNDISGPGGFGNDGFITPDFSLPYTIHFENIASATAPAQLVVVTQQLDADLDFRTFELGNISFGDLEFAVLPGLQSFSARFDVLDRLGIFLDITADFNPLTGLATWTFSSVDPTTFDLPVDPRIGFLPPNKVAPVGEGFVSYSIRAKTNAATGTRFDAQGHVIFDTNASLDTPAIFNTIDAGAPSSSTQPLPLTVTTTQFLVSWSGNDDIGGSGIAHFDIFVSDNEGPFSIWQGSTSSVSAVFPGQLGHKYAFFSTATDNVGHLELAPNSADSVTTVIANNSLPEDVDQDGFVSPLDVLVIINYLNIKLGGPPPPDQPRLDVDLDGFVSPLDALVVINYVNRHAGGGEGESYHELQIDIASKEHALSHDLVLGDLEFDLFEVSQLPKPLIRRPSAYPRLRLNKLV